MKVSVKQLHSLSLQGLGCGHPLCSRLPCSAHHACGRRCQGEFNLIVFSTFVKMSNSFVWNRFSCGNIDRKEFENLTCPLALLQAKSLDGANPWCPAEPNLPWMLVSKRHFPKNSTYCTTQLQKQLSTGGRWCWCHFSPCSENHCGGLFKGNQSGEFLEFFDVQVKIMRLFKNKQRCCSTEAGCCCEFGCTVCLSSCPFLWEVFRSCLISPWWRRSSYGWWQSLGGFSGEKAPLLQPEFTIKEKQLFAGTGSGQTHFLQS